MFSLISDMYVMMFGSLWGVIISALFTLVVVVPIRSDDLPFATRPSCIYEGTFTSTSNWDGYLANVTFGDSGGNIQFEFSYPTAKCCQSVLFYLEEQVIDHENVLKISMKRTN